MDEIDERIRLKAGNVVESQKSGVKSQEPEVSAPKARPPTAESQKLEKKVEAAPAVAGTSKPAEPVSKYGLGISEADIDRIMKEFEDRR